MAYYGSEYLMVALQGETRLGFVKALSNKRNFHSVEGREFVGAVDSWLREHAVLHTTTGAYDPNANSLVE